MPERLNIDANFTETFFKIKDNAFSLSYFYI